MARASRRAKQRDRNNYLLGGLALFLAIAITGTAAYFYFAGRAGQPDPTTLCPSKGPKGHFVLLVDKTDPLTFTQKQAFAVTLKELIEKRTPEGYLLSVFVLGEDFKETAKPIVELCNPGTGADKSELTANLKQLKQQYQRRFLEPLLGQSDALVAAHSAKQSPIVEMLQLVAINGFRANAVKGEKRLFIMSDMLHNTPKFTMYKGLVDYQTFASSDYGKKSQLEMSDVQVEIFYLINTPHLQTKQNLRFWETFFEKAGARIVAVRPLEG